MYFSTRSVSTLLTALTAAATTTAASQTATNSTGRATWLWQTSTVLPSTAEVSSFLAFAASNDINRVYAQADSTLSQSTWTSFLSSCASAGIAVEALIGDPQWIIDDSPMTAVLDWISGVNGFSGIAMDVEPWALDNWDDATQQAEYVSAWQDLAMRVRDFVDEQSGLQTVSAALPFWADEIMDSDSGQGMDVWMLENALDAAVFMTYRNTAGGLWSISQAGLEAGRKTGKQAWLATETQDVGDGLTYYGMAFDDMMADIETVSAEAEAKYGSAFGGFAIEDYNGAVALS